MPVHSVLDVQEVTRALQKTSVSGTSANASELCDQADRRV